MKKSTKQYQELLRDYNNNHETILSKHVDKCLYDLIAMYKECGDNDALYGFCYHPAIVEAEINDCIKIIEFINSFNLYEDANFLEDEDIVLRLKAFSKPFKRKSKKSKTNDGFIDKDGKLVEKGWVNDISLEEILTKIKVEGKTEFYRELFNDVDVKRQIGYVLNKYHFKSGYLVDKDYLVDLIKMEIRDLVDDFKLERCADGNLKNAFLAFLYKLLPKRCIVPIGKERENSWNEKLPDPYDFDEDGNWVNCKSKYDVVLYSNLNNFLNYNELDESSVLTPSFGREFEKMDEHDRFMDIVEDLTDRQRECLRLIFEEQYTEEQAAEEMGISGPCVHKLKQRAIANLRKKMCVDG